MRGTEARSCVDPAPEPWPEIDLARLLGDRPALPDFPVDVLPEGWAGWVADTATATATPIEAVAPLLLGAVAGACGARVVVRLTPGWEEPAVLWQALLAGPAADPSPALVLLRRVLAAVAGATGPAGPGPVVADRPFGDRPAAALLAEAARHPAGALLLREHPDLWVSALEAPCPRKSRRGEAGPGPVGSRRVGSGPVAPGRTLLASWSPQPGASGSGPPAISLLGRLAPTRLDAALARCDGHCIARLLFSWAAQPPWRSLLDRPALREAEAVDALLRLAALLGTSRQPLVLTPTPAALALLDGHLARLHADLAEAGGGLTAAWLAAGPATVARLALVLALLRWMARPTATTAPRLVDPDSMAGAIALWTYFRAHAIAVLERAALDPERLLRHRLRAWTDRSPGDAATVAQMAETPAPEQSARGAGPAGRGLPSAAQTAETLRPDDCGAPLG